MNYDDCDAPDVYRREAGIVKIGRKCTTCKSIISPGRHYIKVVDIENHKVTTFQSCGKHPRCPNRDTNCPGCNGTGKIDVFGHWDACPRCDGAGFIRKQVDVGVLT